MYRNVRRCLMTYTIFFNPYLFMKRCNTLHFVSEIKTCRNITSLFSDTYLNLIRMMLSLAHCKIAAGVLSSLTSSQSTAILNRRPMSARERPEMIRDSPSRLCGSQSRMHKRTDVTPDAREVAEPRFRVRRQLAVVP